MSSYLTNHLKQVLISIWLPCGTAILLFFGLEDVGRAVLVATLLILLILIHSLSWLLCLDFCYLGLLFFLPRLLKSSLFLFPSSLNSFLLFFHIFLFLLLFLIFPFFLFFFSFSSSIASELELVKSLAIGSFCLLLGVSVTGLVKNVDTTLFSELPLGLLLIMLKVSGPTPHHLVLNLCCC